MSDTERTVIDTQGQFLQAVQAGERLPDATWAACRIVLTTERIVLIGEERHELPLAALEGLDDRLDVNQQTAAVADYVTVTHRDDVYLLTAGDHETFETALFRATLNGEIVLVNHPAVEGGVVKDVEWVRGRMTVSAEALALALEDGRTVTVERTDIGDLSRDTHPVAGEERTVLEVEHTQDDISVETHLAGDASHASVLKAMLGAGVARNRADLDLSNTELRVVVALHSGVSPFEIPSFVGIDVETTEAIFDRLLQLDVIDVVRERTEVTLSPKGRRVAGEVIGEP